MTLPELITERSMIRGIIASWEKSYYYPRDGWYDEEKHRICDKLSALDLDTCSVENIAAIIGNDSWTTCQCNQCGSKEFPFVMVGEKPGYDRATAILCRNCIRKVFDVMLDAAP